MTTAIPNPSWRHHYLPEFYLKRWCDPMEAWLLRWEGSRLLPAKQYAPRAMGYGKHLYQIGSGDQIILDGEKQVMGDLDSRAAPLLAAWIDEHKPLTAQEYATLLHFFWAFAARNPETQAILRDRMPSMLRSVEGEVAKLGLDARFLTMFDTKRDGHKAVQLAMIERARDEPSPLSRMPCEVLILDEPLLVTSYYPLVSLPSIGADRALHLIALAPHMAAAFSTEVTLLDTLRASKPHQCASFINRMIAMHSDGIIGRDKATVEELRANLGAVKRDPDFADRYQATFDILKSGE